MNFVINSKPNLRRILFVIALMTVVSNSTKGDGLFTYTNPAETTRAELRAPQRMASRPSFDSNRSYGHVESTPSKLPANATRFFPPVKTSDAQSNISVESPTINLSTEVQQQQPLYELQADVIHAATNHVPQSHCSCPRCQQTKSRDSQGVFKKFAIQQGFGPKPCTEECWDSPQAPPFSVYGPGEYAGPARIQRIVEYRLRSGDTVEMTFMLTPMRTEGAYRLVVGDELIIESEQDEALNRGDFTQGIQVQPDGTITLRYIGQVFAAGQTISQLRKLINEKYSGLYKEPEIDVTPLRTGTAAKQIRDAITGSGGFAGQQLVQTITPSGEIRLPRLGSVQAQGLTLDELKAEINTRYQAIVSGLEIEPALQSQAPHQIFVLGEVATPGRFDLNNSPTTALGALALAGGNVPGANLRQVVVFRRGEAYELMSTVLDLRGAVLGRRANPREEIWLRDGDVIVVPSTPIRLINNLVRQVFTEGIYGVLPTSFQVSDTTTF